ncbi:exocyst complex component 4-like isoform X2 [Lineus longissimus]|uniref:exocyst complex component 4-like isoform X2 n=1 Tax=Lineus longissimus TaxID=88925 RepID=UPI002B4E9512
MAADRSKQRESAGLLMSVIRTLSSSADFTEREKEKSRLEKAFKESDGKLEQLVSENYNDLNQILQSFTKITDRIDASRNKIQLVKQNLDSCKNLLHCKRDDLRKLWLEGVEHKTVVTLLDQIEHLRQVPDKLENYMSKKHYLHATNLIVSAVSSLEGELAGVEALRDLAQELKIKKEQLHEVLIDELHRQIYIKSTSNVVKVFQRQGSTRVAGKRGIRPSRKPTSSVESLKLEHKVSSPISSPPMSPPPDLDLSFPNGVHEDLTSEPEKNQPLFFAILVESLSILKKLPETIEAMKSRIQPELLAIIQRASQQVADSAYQQGETDVLSSLFLPKYLMELLNLVFEEFRCVAMAHRMVLNNLTRVTNYSKSGRDSPADVVLYNMMEVWSKIQAVLQLFLSDYLDIRNTASSQQQAPSSFDVPSTDIATFFAKKRPAKPKKMALFRFEASSHAISMNSYLREQRQEFYGSGEILNRVETISEVGKQLFVCKPGANNVTVIYNPLQTFIKEIQAELGSPHGTPSLQIFITDYVKNIYRGQVHYNISNSINAATKSFDAFKAIVDQRTQKELGVARPLLQSTVVVWKNINELRDLMKALPDYSDDFVNMICKILQEYKDTCLNAYRGIVLTDTDDKRVISATWAKDLDIKRFLRSLPNWQNLKEGKESIDQQRANISEEDMRALNSKESVILNGNLASADSIHPHDIMNDTTQLRSLANLQESFEWFSAKVKVFVGELPTSKEALLSLTQSPEKSFIATPSVPEEVIKKLNVIAQNFEDLAEECLLVLHLEVRVHCFFYLLPVAKQSVYYGATDDMDADKDIINLNRDLTNIDEALTQSLFPRKCKYIFEGLGHLIATILINSTQYLKRINENGIKKMTRNIFSIQQNLTSITGCREPDLDHARQYYELMYLKSDDILTFIMEQGPQFQELEYINIFQLQQRSQPMSNPKTLEQRLKKLKEILHEKLV